MPPGINNVFIDCVKTAHLPSVSSPIATTTRGRVVRPPKSFATTVHIVRFCVIGSRKQTSLNIASASCRAMAFTAGSAVARAGIQSTLQLMYS